MTALCVAVVFVSQERRLADSRFEFGNVRTFTGYLSLSPAPALIIDDGSGPRPHWLVATWQIWRGGRLGIGHARMGHALGHVNRARAVAND